MAISGILSVYNLKNISFSIIQNYDIFAMTPATLRLEAKTKYSLPSVLIKVKINNSEAMLTYVKDKAQFNLTFVFPKRGKVLIEKITVSSYFPFYFFNRILRIPTKYEVIVFPQPIKCDYSFYFSRGNKYIESKQTSGKAYEGETIGVKNYTYNEPLKYIHWKASAKKSELMTKEFSPYIGQPTIVRLLDFSGDMEQKIGKATYAIIQIFKQGIPVGLELENKFYKPDISKNHLRKLMYALALY
jgi:uncharacterized protein (DUF58 family)